jgi:hypothetical protein
MTVATLFKAWDVIQDMLSDPTLSDDENDTLVDQSRQLILALTHAPATGLVDVLLKLEAYGREVEAGPCEECDALLASAMHDRVLILGRLEQGHKPGLRERSGLAAIARDEHRPPHFRPAQQHETVDDQHASPPHSYRGQNPRSAHP